MVRCYGESINWRKEPIDPIALYTSGGVKRHGHWDNASILVNCLSNDCTKCCNICNKYCMLNGVIESREVRAQKESESS
jgi:hypothetical protein